MHLRSFWLSCSVLFFSKIWNESFNNLIPPNSEISESCQRGKKKYMKRMEIG